MKRLARVLVALLVITGVGAGTLVVAGSQTLSPVSTENAAVDFEVPAGASLKRVARDLEAAGLIRGAWSFELLARWRGLAAELRAGEYELSAALTPDEILERLAAGRVRTHELVIPEGLRAEQVAERVEAAGLAEAEAFLAVARDPAVAREWGVEGTDLEGYLFPETYQLAKGLSAREVARALVDQFHEAWKPIAPKAESRGLTMKEVVTLASIVEKETSAGHERPLIAGVFHNRLRRGMRLETDPTVIYGIRDFDGNLTRRHLEDTGNPYNTYRIKGLPPGPIANPGSEALRAVVEPEETEYLYFVSRNDGTHYFSKSYREHARAVDRFQRGKGASR